MRVVQFASVSSCARTSPLEALQLQQLFMMRTTDDLGMPVPVIFHGLCCEFGLVHLTQNHIVHLVNVFIRAGTSRFAAALTSVQLCLCL